VVSTAQSLHLMVKQVQKLEDLADALVGRGSWADFLWMTGQVLQSGQLSWGCAALGARDGFTQVPLKKTSWRAQQRLLQ
jgi:hypothetical protein